MKPTLSEIQVALRSRRDFLLRSGMGLGAFSLASFLGETTAPIAHVCRVLIRSENPALSA